MGEPWRYRHKVQGSLPCHRQPSGFRLLCRETHDLVEFEDCLVQPEVSTAVLKTLRALALDGHWTAYDEDRGTGLAAARRVADQPEVPDAGNTGQSHPDFPDAAKFCERLMTAHPNVVGILQNVNPEKTNRIMGRDWKALQGKDFDV